jgi:magnesium transporter
MLETLIARYEKILFALLVECRTCMCYSTEISYKERVEYLVRVSVSEKSLIYLAQLVRPKIQIMKSLLVYYRHDKKFRPYIKCLKGRIKKMNGLIETGTQLLEKAKQLYMTCSDDNLRKTSFSSGGLMKFYAGISTLFLPPALMTGLWGTNVMLPGEEDKTTGTFFVMIGVSIAYFIIGFLYLKKIGYI